MKFDLIQIEELKRIAPQISTADEGGYSYILIEKLKLPEGCKPSEVDALLCPTPRDRYESRLFFAEMITGCPNRNWNGTIRVLQKNWYAISWRVNSGLSLSEMLMIHLSALRNP